MKIKTTLFITCYILFNSWILPAQTTIDVTTFTGGTILFNDSKYSVSGTTTNYSGAYILTGTYSNSSSSRSNYILINAGAYSDDAFTLENFSFTNTATTPFIISEDSLKLHLTGNNVIEGLASLSLSTGTSISLTGDSLTAVGRNAGIGNYNNVSLKKIDIRNKYLYVQTGTSSTHPAIGAIGSRCDSIVVDGTVVTAVAGTDGYGLQASHICIYGGSVKGSLSTTAVNAVNEAVYCVTVPHNGQLSIQMNNGAKDSTLTFFAHHPDDNNFYIYLPNGSYSFTNGDGNIYKATVAGAGVTAFLEPVEGDGVIDVSEGVVSISEGAYYVGAQPYTYSGRKFTVTGIATDWGITVESGADSITIDNLDIQSTGSCAFNIQTNANLALTLKGKNTLVSADGYAGLQKTTAGGVLTIDGTNADTLVATGGQYGAGIGAGDCSNITIKGGVITAVGGYGAAGIGGNYLTDASYIIIEGGIVNATGGIDGGTGIGGGRNSSGSYITISGGVITAKGQDVSGYSGGSAIGGYYAGPGTDNVISGGIVYATGASSGNALPEGITISGGTVYAWSPSEFDYETSGKYRYAFVGGTITGGSVTLEGKEGEGKTDLYTYYNGSETIEGRPVNADSELLYRSMYKIPGITEMTLVNSITINDVPWNCNDLYTDSEGCIYLWLPLAESSNTVIISANGEEYSYMGKIIAYDDYVAPDEDEGISEYGNYWWQAKISIDSPESGTLSVTGDNGAVADGAWLCNNTELLISATPDAGYNLASLTVNDEPVTNNSIYVVRDDAEIKALFEVPTAVNNIPDEAYDVYSNEGNIYVEAPGNMQISVYNLSGQIMFETTSSGCIQRFNVGKAGLYFVKIFGANVSRTVKCIVGF